MPPPFNPLLVDSLPTGPTWENNSHTRENNPERSDHVDQTFQPLRQITARLLHRLSAAQARFVALQASLSSAQNALNGFSQTWEAFQRQVVDVLDLSEETLTQASAASAGSEGLPDTESIEENIRTAQAVAHWRWRVSTPQSDVADPPGGVIEPMPPMPPIQVLQADAPNPLQVARGPIRPIQVPEAAAPDMMVGTTITDRFLEEGRRRVSHSDLFPNGTVGTPRARRLFSFSTWGHGRVNLRDLFPIEPMPGGALPVFTRDDVQDDYALLDDLDSGEINETELEDTTPPEWEPNPSVFSVEELDVGSEPLIMMGIDPAMGESAGGLRINWEDPQRFPPMRVQDDTGQLIPQAKAAAPRTIWDFID